MCSESAFYCGNSLSNRWSSFRFSSNFSTVGQDQITIILILLKTLVYCFQKFDLLAVPGLDSGASLPFLVGLFHVVKCVLT